MMQQPTGMIPPPMTQQPQQQQYPHALPPQQWAMMPQQQQPPPQAQPPAMWTQQAQPAAVPPPQMQTQQPMQPQGSGSDEIRSLWIGDLQYWMDENYIYGCFAHTGEVSSVKIIRNKQTTQSEGYGFIEFVSRAAAERMLQTYNGTLMPNVEQNFRLNWASLGAGERRADDTPDYTIFVGDLASDVTDYTLHETFRSHYQSVKGAKVVIDRTSGRSKGYGFVRFGDESEQLRAMTEMNGMLCSTRAMRIGPAAKKPVGGQQYTEGEIIGNNDIEDVRWLCSLSEFELDMLIGLKKLVLHVAKETGLDHLAPKFDLKVLRALGFILMEYMGGQIKDMQEVLDSIDLASLLDGSNLLKTNVECRMSDEEIKACINPRKRRPINRFGAQRPL